MESRGEISKGKHRRKKEGKDAGEKERRESKGERTKEMQWIKERREGREERTKEKQGKNNEGKAVEK